MAFRAQQPRLSDLVPWRDLEPHFQATHTHDLLPLLGETCWADYCARLETEALTPADEALRQAARPWLASRILQRYLASLPHLRLDALGTVAYTGPEYRFATEAERHTLLWQVAHEADRHLREFRQWLAQHSLSYPCLPADTVPCAPANPSFPDVPVGTAH
jgi:hypothetical protein